MFRGLAVAAMMMAALATGAAGQQSVGVTAVVVEDVSHSPLDVQWQAGPEGRLVVIPPAPEPGAETRFVEQVWLARPDWNGPEAGTGRWRRTDTGLERARRGGAVLLLELLEGLETSAVQVAGDGGAEGLILIRVIASNS